MSQMGILWNEELTPSSFPWDVRPPCRAQFSTTPFLKKKCFFHPVLITTLYRKSDLCIPRNETARPRFQFLHSCVCEQFIYSQVQSAYLAAAKQADRSWEYIHECGNWEIEHYNSVLEITRLPQFHFQEYINWNQTLSWILTGPSFAVCASLSMLFL